MAKFVQLRVHHLVTAFAAVSGHQVWGAEGFAGPALAGEHPDQPSQLMLLEQGHLRPCNTFAPPKNPSPTCTLRASEGT
jgi:hypothetical protein